MEQMMDISVNGRAMTAFFARPDSANNSGKGSEKEVPGILLLHEIWGLNENIKDIARRLSDEGYAVLAPGLFAGTGMLEKLNFLLQRRTKEVTDEDVQQDINDAFAAMQHPAFMPDMMQKLSACFRFLDSHSSGIGKIGILGFEFGGTCASVFAANVPSLQACISFYGTLSPKNVMKIRCPVLALYGEKDEGLIGQISEIEHAVKEKKKKDVIFKVYEDAGHAFFNEKNPELYNRKAADDAWKLVLKFLK